VHQASDFEQCEEGEQGDQRKQIASLSALWSVPSKEQNPRKASRQERGGDRQEDA
jgi:hypothetical protein